MERLLTVGLLFVLLVSMTTATGAGSAVQSDERQRALQAAQDFDSVEFRIIVHENNSAQWTFYYKRELTNESEQRQFSEFAEKFNSQETRTYRDFKSRAQTLTDIGQRETGRQMEARNFSKRAYVSPEPATDIGITRMSFVWTNFSYNEGDRIVMGDAFQGGMYLGSNQSLVIQPGEGLVFDSLNPPPDEMEVPNQPRQSNTVTWNQEREFSDSRPRVVFVQNSSTGNVDTIGPAGDGSQLWTLIAAGVLVLLGIGAAIVWRQSDGFGGLLSNQDGPGDAGGAASMGGGSDGQFAGRNQPAISDEELLTDEARVKKLLRENGGRMKQVNIVDETSWSKSKVSMLLSEMEDQNEINKLRVGRENIISLDGHEPEAARSPHEE